MHVTSSVALSGETRCRVLKLDSKHLSSVHVFACWYFFLDRSLQPFALQYEILLMAFVMAQSFTRVCVYQVRSDDGY